MTTPAHKTGRTAKLTKAQVRVLWASERRTFSDNSGEGYSMYDGHDARVAKRLSELGLVTVSSPYGGHPWGAVKITENGRAALSASRSTGDQS